MDRAGPGLAALELVLRKDVGTVAVGAVDWSQPETRKGGTFFAELVSDGRDGIAERPADLVLRLREAETVVDRERLLTEFVREEARAVLQLSSPPPSEVGFFDLGMDSLMLLDLRNRVNRALAGEYVAPNTVMFDHPSAIQLARHLNEHLAPPPDGERGVAEPPPPEEALDDPISADEFVRMLDDLDDDDV